MKHLCKAFSFPLQRWLWVAAIAGALIGLACCTPAQAAQGIVDARLTGPSNTLQSGATFTANTGSTFVFSGTVTFSAPLSLANGGLGVSLSDPGADRIVFWDDSAGHLAFLANGSGILISGTTISFDTSVAAPVGASYITKVAESGLSGEFALGSLATGLLQVTATTGNLSSVHTSAALLALISDANGTGSLVFDTSPELTTPSITGSISFASDTRQTFVPGATVAGINVGSVSSDPSTLLDGDIWYNSTGHALKIRSNGSTVSLGGGGSGDVVGPVSSTDTRLAVFNGPTGKLLQDSSGITVPSAGTLTSNTAFAINAGGSNQDVTITPSGTGALRLNGHVGINTPAGSASLFVLKAGSPLSAGASETVVYQNSGSSGDAINVLAAAGSTGTAGYWLCTSSGFSGTYGGINYDNSVSSLSIQANSAERIHISSSGSVKFNNYGAGTLTTDSSGNITATSDERLKDIHGHFNAGLTELSRIVPIAYSWRPESGNETAGTYAGFSAQNVQAVIPEAVGTMADGHLTLQDRPMIAALVNAVNDLHAQLDHERAVRGNVDTAMIVVAITECLGLLFIVSFCVSVARKNRA